MSLIKQYSILTRIGCMILAFFLLVISACAQQEKFKTITTFTVIADIARNVAGNAATVESIMKPGAEIHEYQPTPGDLKRAKDASLVFWNGMNLETWFEKFFQHLRNTHDIVVSTGIEPITITGGPYNGKLNPHAWMSPSAALLYVDNIRDAFIKYDSANAKIYLSNAENYKNKIKSTIEPMRKQIAKIPKEKRWLLSSEGAFSYLARDFCLKELYLWPINADQQGTPQQVRKVIDTIRKYKITVIFSESTISSKPARQVASETKIKYGGVLYVDSLTDEKGKVPTYLDLLKVTVGTIARELTSS